MSNGTIHGKVTLALIPSSFTIGFAISPNITDGLFSMLGCILGLIIEPDLDVDHKTKSEYRVYKIFKPFGALWYYIWLPYAKLMPHRHFLSHAPIIGTILRYFYLSTVILLLSFLFGELDFIINLIEVYNKQILFLFLGTVNSDFGHWIMDNL